MNIDLEIERWLASYPHSEFEPFKANDMYAAYRAGYKSAYHNDQKLAELITQLVDMALATQYVSGATAASGTWERVYSDVAIRNKLLTILEELNEYTG